MPTQAKRYGLEIRDDLETELRFRRIEQRLEELIASSDLDTEGGQTVRSNTVPQVTGFRVVGSTPGAVTLGWNAIPISDLRRYELEIADNIGFTDNKQTFFVAGTQFQFSTQSASGGGGGAIIYARVRARNRAGNVGPYSITLNTSTGQAQQADIGEQAVGEEQIEDVVIEGLTITVSDNVHTFTPVTRLNFNPDHFYLAGDNSLGDDPIVNLNVGWQFRSSGLLSLPSAGNDVTWAHGHNGTPEIVKVFLVNVTTDLGHAVGDRIPVTTDLFGSISDGQPSYGTSVNATNVIFTRNNDGGSSPIYITGRGATPGARAITINRWRLLFHTVKIV